MVLPSNLAVAQDIARALANTSPVVALESTVITHGLPHPENLELAQAMEAEVRAAGGLPATVAVLDGRLQVGLDAAQLERLAQGEAMVKISTRDLGPALALGLSGGTTVAATLFAAHRAGIRVFATGGIGGVHRQASHDVSADLYELARTPMIVVCAGAKAILDLPATLERLETLGVPVLGYQTDHFPAFYSRDSGLAVTRRVDSPGEVAGIAAAHWRLGLPAALLVTVPPPPEVALPLDEVENAIEAALEEAQEEGVRGPAVTPFLLARVSALTGGASLQANLGLLRQNARVAAQIAVEVATRRARRHL